MLKEAERRFRRQEAGRPLADDRRRFATNPAAQCFQTACFSQATPVEMGQGRLLAFAVRSRRDASSAHVVMHQGSIQMKIAIVCATALLLSGASVYAQGNPSGRGSVTGDPAASSANPNAEPAPRGRSTTNPSGSGTSTSGGRDDNADQGRDTMPETAKQPTPQAQQKGLPK